jgi:hypothetical protein
MTNLIRIALLAGIVLSAGSAHAKIETLGDCYNKVIAACNKTAHPIPCSNSGMDQCDEQFEKFELPPTRKTPGFKAN